MTEQEYNEQLSRVDRYYEYTKIIKNLEFKVRAFESDLIRRYIWRRRPDMLKNKIVEAYKEQIDIIKKRMEEL